MPHGPRPLSDVQLSKRLSWLLRHGAVQRGLPLQADGFVPVDAVLQLPDFATHYTQEVFQRLVDIDSKQRYTMRQNPTSGRYEIRANQGHSLRQVEAVGCLQQIHHATEVPMAVHGTYRRHWTHIRKEGLKRMTRNHIHFAAHDQPQSGSSGFRSDCQLLIYLDVPKVLADGVELYRSSNNVILCAGIDGCLCPAYFIRVVDRRSGALLDV